MLVRVLECKDGIETECAPRDLREMLGDDDEDYYRAVEEIKRSGRVWIGGGAAPLFLAFAA